MNEKEMKRLSRADLLELLLQERRENESLHAEIESLREQLEDRTIKIQKAGSIAEASLQLSGIFDTAQKAAEQYLENIRLLSREQEKICKQMEAETEEKCRKLETETKQRCREMVRKADQESSACWSKISKYLEDFYQLRKEQRKVIADQLQGKDQDVT